jgi:ribosomal protein L22
VTGQEPNQATGEPTRAKAAAAKKPKEGEKTPAAEKKASARKASGGKATGEKQAASGERKAAKAKAERKPAGEKAAKPAAERKAPARKRAAAEKRPAEQAQAPEPTARPKTRKAKAAPPRRKVVRARARFVRTSARKARMVCGHLRGKTVQEARAILAFTPREVARDWSKLLESAVANAETNHELLEDDLVVREAYADEGPTIKRFRPRAMGRATPIRKRTSHLTITLTPGEPGNGRRG